MTTPSISLESVNLYSDAFLNLADHPVSSRRLLIEAAYDSEDLLDLVEEWALIHFLQPKELLKIKIWFQFNYQELAKIFGLSIREVAQWLKNLRLQRLSEYRVEDGDSTKASLRGMTCFMFEQYLSAWSDNEINEQLTLALLDEHSQACAECQSRRNEYRQLQSELLRERKSFHSISVDEWNFVIGQAKKMRWARTVQWSSVAVLLVSLSLILAWVIASKPEKMPNVYEIQER